MLKQNLFRYQGQVSAALVLGGMDINGPSLYSIYPHGSVDKLPYVTMGTSTQLSRPSLAFAFSLLRRFRWSTPILIRLQASVVSSLELGIWN